MERSPDYTEIRKLFGKNFIGPQEIDNAGQKMNILALESAPQIPFTMEELITVKDTHLLFLAIAKHTNGEPVTLLSLRSLFGCDPAESEPCFYNQDWYLKETFITQSFSEGWYLFSKELKNESRGLNAKEIRQLSGSISFPPASLTAYVFFLFYFHSAGELLLKNDYTWNSDTDANGDRIYVGKYSDPLGINKNGFEVHRHLSLKSNYGTLDVIV